MILVALALFGSAWAEGLPVVAQAGLLVSVFPISALAARRVLSSPVGILELRPGGCVRWAAGTENVIEAKAVLHEQWPVLSVRLLPQGPILVFWPDTLYDSGRRALRRWAGAAPEATPLSQFWTG